MASKVFLDANVLLDFTLQRPGFAAADALLEAGILRNVQLYTSPAVLHIVSYFLGQNFNRRQIREIVITLLNDVRIIECDHDTVLTAAQSGIDDMEDTILYYTALTFNVNYFVSADKKLKKSALPQLPVCTAMELGVHLNF